MFGGRVLACPRNWYFARPRIQNLYIGDKQLKRFLTLGAAVGLLTATAAWADTFERYGEVEGWKVFIDNEKKSCLIEAVDDAENVVQMGLTEDRGVGYVGVFTKADTDIKRGETQEVAILIGDNIYLGEATGMKGNITKGYSGGYVLSDNPQFADDLAKKKSHDRVPRNRVCVHGRLDWHIQSHGNGAQVQRRTAVVSA